MSITRLTTQCLSLASLLGLFSSQALADGTCSTQNRDFADQNFVTISCDLAASIATKAKLGTILVGTTRTLSVELLTQCNATGGCTATVSGLNAAGQVIPGCVVTDSALGGGPVTLPCAAMVKYRGDIVYK